MIARFVEELAAALDGPRRVRACLLAEVRDGLDDAAVAHRSRSLSETAAETRAVTEFGRVSDLVPLFQAELTANQARRTAALLAVCFPTLFALWELFSLTGHRWTSASEVAGWLAEATDVASGVTAGAAVAGLLLLVSGEPEFGARLARWRSRSACSVVPRRWPAAAARLRCTCSRRRRPHLSPSWRGP